MNSYPCVCGHIKEMHSRDNSFWALGECFEGLRVDLRKTHYTTDHKCKKYTPDNLKYLEEQYVHKSN